MVRDDHRDAPASISADTFRELGHRLVDQVADFLGDLPSRRVNPALSPDELRRLRGNDALPDRGVEPAEAFERAATLVLNNSVLTAHPRFWAYVHGAASPIGALADFLASALNSPVTSWTTGPISSAIEEQAVSWIAELVGYPADAAGIFLSGGTMATVVGISAALYSRAGWDVREQGLTGDTGGRLRIYASREAHSCVVTAAHLIGLGKRAIRWIDTDEAARMNASDLRARLDDDRAAGLQPFLVFATAGTTPTGAVDPIEELADVCKEHGLWLHVDGAYGGVAACAADAPSALGHLAEADSLVVDPHKWLYVPLEAGCLLTRHRRILYDTFRYGASYYSQQSADVEALPFRDQSPQTSRGFKALKTWMLLQCSGREGYAHMISEDITLARRLYEIVAAEPALEAFTHSLSITTFRYVPPDLAADAAKNRDYLNRLNEALLERLQLAGEAYPSHTTVSGCYVLRVCIVNYNTTRTDIEALPVLVVRVGAETDATLRASE